MFHSYESVKFVNLALRFLLELCALVALGYWSFKGGGGPIMKLALGIGAPLLAAVVWGMFLAPRAAVPSPGLLRLVLELGVFGAAAAALYAAGRPALSWALAKRSPSIACTTASRAAIHCSRPSVHCPLTGVGADDHDPFVLLRNYLCEAFEVSRREHLVEAQQRIPDFRRPSHLFTPFWAFAAIGMVPSTGARCICCRSIHQSV